MGVGDWQRNVCWKREQELLVGLSSEKTRRKLRRKQVQWWVSPIKEPGRGLGGSLGDNLGKGYNYV